MSDLVDPIPKQGGRSPQRQRRLDFEREFRKAKAIVRVRSRGWCEVQGCDRKADHTHHKAGRVPNTAQGRPNPNDPDLLLDVCVQCDHRITTEPEWAEANGYSMRRT